MSSTRHCSACPSVKDMLHIRKYRVNCNTPVDIYEGTNPGSITQESLHIASWQGATNEVAVLLAAGVACSVRDHYGRTPLHDAATKGHMGIAELLLSYGANVDARDRNFRMTPLHWAAFRGHAGMVWLLLTNGANPYLKDQDRKTAETLARGQGHHQVITILREIGFQGAKGRER